MSDWMGEYESSIELASEAARQLLRLDPNHDLLKFWFCRTDEMTDGKPIPEVEANNRLEMKDRFWQRPDSWQQEPGVIVATVVTTNYYLALKKAIKGIDPTVSV